LNTTTRLYARTPVGEPRGEVLSSVCNTWSSNANVRSIDTSATRSPTKADILTSRDGLKSINNSINIIIIIIGDYYTTALNALLLFFDALLLVIIKYSFFSFRIFLLLLAKYAFPH
jgi:hypothetical protein